MIPQIQTVRTLRGGVIEKLKLPSSRTPVLPGVKWGRFDEFFTPAFWAARVWIDGCDSNFLSYRLGNTLEEEVAACLLGGHGFQAEIGVAAFQRLRERELLCGCPSAQTLESALSQPFIIDGRPRRYRYPRAKAHYLSGALRQLRSESPPTDDLAFRNWLITFNGIGPKTASWITRNYRHSDRVAILDVHIIQAGCLIGLFSSRDCVSRNYFDMEKRLLRFASAINVKLSLLDSLIWCYMRRLRWLHSACVICC